MNRDFIQLVSETVDEAHAKGIDLFYESLENSLNKEYVVEQHGLENTLTTLFEENQKQSKEEIEDLK